MDNCEHFQKVCRQLSLKEDVTYPRTRKKIESTKIKITEIKENSRTKIKIITKFRPFTFKR